MVNPIKNSTLGRTRRERWNDKTFNRILMEIVGPVLIILMIGALVFFLIEIFYRGPHAARLGWVLGLFTIAAVLVSRISIEGGPERALLFGVPLAAATLVVTIRLVDFEYGNLAVLEPVVVALFIGVVMWSANRLTWDCTMIDDSRDVSSIGLTELVKRKLFERTKKRRNGNATTVQVEATDSIDQPQAAERPSLASRLFFLMFANKKNQNTPGLWVFYFSLAAFPIFGFGQWFAQPSDGWGYRWIFFLFAIYLASGLGLLMLTSLLGLERYLNKRGAELPTNVSQTWMLVGSLFAIAVMLVMLLLPSPSISNGLENALAVFTTNNKNTSEHALGKDGQEQGEKPRNEKEDNQADGAKKRDADGGQDKGKGKNGKTKSNEKGGKESGKGKGKSKNQQNGKQDSKSGKSQKSDSNKNQSKQDQSKSDSKSKSDNSNSENSKSNDSKDGKSKNDPKNAKKNEDGKNQDGDKDRDKKQNQPNQVEQQENQAKQNNQAQKKRNNGQQRQNDPPPPQNSTRSPSGAGKFLATLMRFVVYGVGLIALLVVAWMFRDELAKLWNDLFGTKEEEEPEEKLAVEKRRLEKSLPSFSHFNEPFSNGMASKWPAAQTIQYTFQALEAWGRGFEQPREHDQTPHEFAKRLGTVDKAVAKEAHHLADLHGESLFSGGAVDKSAANQLKKLWKLMTAHPPNEREVRLVGEG